MPSIRVPQRHQHGIKLIASFDEASMSILRSAFEDSSLDPGAIVDSLAATGLSGEDRRRLVEALVPLYIVKAETDTPAEELAAKVVEDLSSWDPETAAQNSQQLEKNLISLLALKKTTLRAKIIGLLTSDERVFCDARIVTDLRPAFSQSIEAGPIGMGVIHLVTIGFHSRGEHRETQVALTKSDLGKLKASIERAEQKAASLKEFLAGADVDQLGEDL